MKKNINLKLDELESEIKPENEDLYNEFILAIENGKKEDIKAKYEKFKQMDDAQKKERVNQINEKLSTIEKIRKALSKNVNIDPSRLIALTDGIFGMVITLLAFGISLPENIIDYPSFLLFIQELLPNIGIVLISFVLVSTFWIYHHEFMKIKTINLPFLWLNIIYLACISFIPFTTNVIGHYSQFFYANVIFGLNIFITISSFMIMYPYANNHELLEDKVSFADKKYTINTFSMIMLFTIIVNLLDFLVSPIFMYLYLLIPLISTLRDIRFNNIL